MSLLTESVALDWLKEHKTDSAIVVVQIADNQFFVCVPWRRSDDLHGIGYSQNFPNETSARNAVKTQARRYIGSGKPSVLLFDLRPKVVDWLTDEPAVAEPVH